jgi:peptidyl-prolyl cis-trans isomerase C
LRARQTLGRLIREPLVHFLIVGLVLYAAGHAYARRHDHYRIDVTAERAAQLAETYRKQYGQSPDAQMRELLIQNDIDNEILYREGLRLKLDQDDEIVRRRIIQKMQFLAQNLHAPAEPTEAQIEAFFREHVAMYARPPAVSFTHVFFTDEARARRALSQLRASHPSRAPEIGDPFPDLHDFAKTGSEQVQRLFGHSPLSEAVFAVPLGQWSGPFRSGYGWHLLLVTARSALEQSPLTQVRDKVRSDFLNVAQKRQNHADFQQLRGRFTIVRSDSTP